MSDFKAKMHKFRSRLKFRPRPRRGSLQRSPDPLASIQVPASKGREGKKGGGEKRREGKGGERKGKEGKRGEGRDLLLPQAHTAVAAYDREPAPGYQ